MKAKKRGRDPVPFFFIKKKRGENNTPKRGVPGGKNNGSN
jgi:hypothetical protein